MQRNWLTEKRGSLTHQEVAEKAGIDRSFYTQIESGLRNPSVDTAQKIASALGFEWTIFFDEKRGEMQQSEQTATKAI